MLQQKKWIFVLVLSLSFYIAHHGLQFQADIFSPSLPFDGTVMPVEKVPDWSRIKPNLWQRNYQEIPNEEWINIPNYDSAVLKIKANEVFWNKDSDRSVFNTKATYVVPYMGDYKFSGLEYTGSHLGVDIRLPKDTPINAIGNGVVIKTIFKEDGFGEHLVIRHDHSPSMEDPNIKVTYYSSYSHLDKILVKEGDRVFKGQNIALSGQSGAASIPHLHFQIDNAKAPWHPYWPYTSKEVELAGYKNDTESVNEGLGKEKALANTIHPLLYIQKYQDFSSITELRGSAPEVLSRAEALKLILDESEMNLKISKKQYFKDVKSTEEEFKYINAARAAGLVDGYDDETFKPSQKITQAEFLKILMGVKRIKLSAQSEASIWYEPYLQYASSKKLIIEASEVITTDEALKMIEIIAEPA